MTVLPQPQKRYCTTIKIDRTGPSSPSSSVKRTGRSGKSETAKQGGFESHIEKASGASGGVSGLEPTGSVDALLALQEVEAAGDATSGRSNAKARQWGESVLDRLERLRLELISGNISRDNLHAIARIVREKRESAPDERLEQVLIEIELRARVELAKFERG